MADELAAAGEGAGDIGEDADGEPEVPDAGVTPDARELEDTIRRVIREEAADADSVATPDAQEQDDTIREIIREELAGEMGQRLSNNIRRMIRDEVAHAMLRRN